MVDDHRKSRKLVQEHMVACIPWPKVSLNYIGDECCETRSAESIERSLDERCTFMIGIMDLAEVVTSCLPPKLHCQDSLVMVLGSDGSYIFH